MSRLHSLLCALGIHKRRALHTSKWVSHGVCSRCSVDMCHRVSR